MKVKFAPFGIGPTDMDINSDVIKEKGKSAFFFALGCGVIAAEVALRYTSKGMMKTADVIVVGAGHVDDAHDHVVEYASQHPHLTVATKMHRCTPKAVKVS